MKQIQSHNISELFETILFTYTTFQNFGFKIFFFKKVIILFRNDALK